MVWCEYIQYQVIVSEVITVVVLPKLFNNSAKIIRIQLLSNQSHTARTPHTVCAQLLVTQGRQTYAQIMLA